MGGTEKIRKEIIMTTIKSFREIYGKNLSLITLNKEYLDDMWEYSKEPKLYEFFEYKPFTDKKELNKYFLKIEEKSKKINCNYWFVQENISKKVIGSMNAYSLDPVRNSCMIGFAISPHFWGQGVIDEILELIIKELFHYYNMNRISAVTYSSNTRCIKKLLKFNFQIEGNLKEYYKDYNGIRHDATLLALTKKSINEI